MFCYKCGKAFDSNFCPDCGAPQAVPAANETPVENSVAKAAFAIGVSSLVSALLAPFDLFILDGSFWVGFALLGFCLSITGIVFSIVARKRSAADRVYANIGLACSLLALLFTVVGIIGAVIAFIAAVQAIVELMNACSDLFSSC